VSFPCKSTKTTWFQAPGRCKCQHTSPPRTSQILVIKEIGAGWCKLPDLVIQVFWNTPTHLLDPCLPPLAPYFDPVQWVLLICLRSFIGSYLRLHKHHKAVSLSKEVWFLMQPHLSKKAARESVATTVFRQWWSLQEPRISLCDRVPCQLPKCGENLILFTVRNNPKWRFFIPSIPLYAKLYQIHGSIDHSRSHVQLGLWP